MQPYNQNKSPFLSDVQKPSSNRPSFSYDQNDEERKVFEYFANETEEKKEQRIYLPEEEVIRDEYIPLPTPPSRVTRVAVFGISLLLSGAILSSFFYGKQFKSEVIGEGEAGYENLHRALDEFQAENYKDASEFFYKAAERFGAAERKTLILGGIVSDIFRYIPGLSQVASGRHAIEAGKEFALAGIPLSEIAENFSSSHAALSQGEKVSLLSFLSEIRKPLEETKIRLENGNKELQKVKVTDLPLDKREKFLAIKNDLPVVLNIFSVFDRHEVLINEILGGNGPRKYLFLLQNNHEMRATGGFIGSYALLDVNNGVIREFFVDGIFNPDGQLKKNIIPPKPIQKISAAWSLHDSNWFPDFPTSAEKAMFFYEKTGGPTVDGVITLTPTVMQKLLQVTGPIVMKEYGVTIDAENFIPVVQEQVEVKYDKEENKPKKILSDLSILILEKAFSSQDKETLYRVGQALIEGLNEKHILLYMRHPETEKLIREAGWSGEVMETEKDYLSVIHSNINGYKTDGVIDERIRHIAKIEEDGTVLDTIAITRTHNGGNTPYEWWNKVNADYLRVYVPLGSELLSAKGATWEFPEAPLDYARLGFEEDVTVGEEEKHMVIDEKSGTRISENAGKTVFGNWVYVSPGESVTVEYTYKLPFKIELDKKQESAESYSMLFQKQAGSIGSKLEYTLDYPQKWKVIWQTASNLVPYERNLKLDTDLRTDVFAGVVFGSNE